MCCLVDDNTACGKYLIRVALSGSSKDGFYTCHQDLWTERFGNIFVYAKFKSQKFITFIPSCCQHNDGNFGILTDLTTYFPAVHLRHHHVQDQQCNVFFFIKNIHGFLTVTGFQYLEILFDKEIFYQFSHSALVIYYKNL